ncbi:hypothetical protein [Archangium sp.]|uniref:hypothetical protein n=1 Tax=Archangium sp. TaxID=1872627 RepID=UPI002D4CC3E2|nr:hypothetical protein [Archangium sp.]HYO58306.1 hypothetical protein [Archangium sp.]
MPRGWVVLLCMVVLGCSGTAPSIRSTPKPPQRCVYIPRRDGAAGARKEAVTAPQAGMRVVLVAATAGAAPVEPLTPLSAPPLEGLSGEGLGDGVPRGVLRLVPDGGPGAEVGAGGAAGKVVVGEVVVVGGAVVAAVGSGLLVCLTARAAANGEKTPIDIADEYYGTHFGDVMGWVQGQYPTQASPGVAPKPEPDKSDKERLGRIYVTYTKLNKTTHRFYAGRTSMIVDLTQSLALQAIAAILLRDKNHHMDESAEPENAAFADAEVDRFDVGSAIDYGQRYDDVAYWRIRGREQQLIDSLGGARSDTGEPYRTENAVRGVAKDNLRGRRFHEAATELWGLLHPYTGY